MEGAFQGIHGHQLEHMAAQPEAVPGPQGVDVRDGLTVHQGAIGGIQVLDLDQGLAPLALGAGAAGAGAHLFA